MRIASAVLVLLSISRIASAWGGEGHQIIALIAETRLTPDAHVGIRELLGPDVYISDAEVASWADEIRRERGRPSTATWHYVNIPIDAERYDAKRDSPKTTDIIEATASQIAAISDKSLPTEKRAEALKFVIHLIGDLHQPLHCGDRNDKGGNGTPVYLLEVKGKPKNLHSTWDTALPKLIKAGERVMPYADRLGAEITKEQERQWASGSLIAWANETHDVSREVAYRDVPTVKVEGEMLAAESASVPVLDQAYVDRAKPVIEEQFKRGSVRLAAVINRAFAK